MAIPKSAVWFLAVPLMSAVTFQSEIAQWRQDREARLRSDDGWLTVAGLFWLHEGANSFGANAKNDVVLPAGPAHAGVLELHAGKVAVDLAGNKQVLRPDTDDVAHVDRLQLFIIERSGRYGVRMKDPQSEYRRNFRSLEYFPANPEYRVRARFVEEPKEMSITNILGQIESDDSPGYAVFTLHGHEYRLRPVYDDPDSKDLFFIFRDLTSEKESYGAGRFLDTPSAKGGKVTLDFNKAYNPPCAFTPYATCPLPPKENRLAVRIEAGEKKYGD
jgi:hypothetical protein